MIHYGDITKISGYDVPIVDCIIGGSPCQELSVAGKRAGLDGERSALFTEQIRITKEMRERDERSGRTGEHIRPRFFVWENVPGVFSSNKAEDFRVVLEEVAKVVDKDAVIPMPPKNKWTTSGCIVGDGWSIAWRIFDAQFWGVPQRRRRISLVADFGGKCAQEVLFERKGLRGHSSESRTKRKGASADAQGCIGVYDRDGKECISLEPGIASREGGHIYENVSGTLRANAGDNQMSVAYGFDQGATRDVGALFIEEKAKTLTNGSCPGHHNGVVLCIENHPADSRVNIDESGKVQTLTSRMGTGGGNVPMVMQPYRKQSRAKTKDDATTWVEADVSNTLNTFDISETRCNEVVVVGLDAYNQQLTEEKTMCLRSKSADTDHIPCVVMDRSAFNQGINAKYNIGIDENGVAFSHIAKGPGAVCYCVDQGGGKSGANVTENLSPTLACTHGGEPVVCLETFHCIAEEGGTSFQGKARDYKDVHVICLQGNQVDRADTSVCNGSGFKEDVSYTLNTMDKHCVAYRKPHYIVRRLTPLECERLQGFPDGWTDIGEYTDSKGKKKQSSDSARYKALGNSIALPPWKWVLKRICSHYERDATMASLFDGIGGFPYLWEQINGNFTCPKASEIEDFPIAVTKARIG